MNTPELLKHLRESHGFSQQYVADKLNIGRTTYVKYESGASNPTRKFAELASLYGVTVDYLMGRHDSLAPIENKKIPKDLKKILEEEEITLNGRMMSAEDKEKIYRVIEVMYHDAKEQNKRK